MDNSKPSGVYRNPRLMHVCTTIVGMTVHLQTKDGSVWEGIFKSFNQEFTICLKLAIQIDPKLPGKDYLAAALKKGESVREKAFFDLKDIVRISVADVDLKFATKEAAAAASAVTEGVVSSSMPVTQSDTEAVAGIGGAANQEVSPIKTQLVTDTEISGFDPNKLNDSKELESWQDDDGDNINSESMLSLDEVASANRSSNQNNSRGWDAQDMFRYNEKVHNVSSTYDESLRDYTIALPKHNSKDWRKKQERAAVIAKEIETNPKSQNRLAKEDGSDCEEEKFSAVQRPTPPTSQVGPSPQHNNSKQDWTRNKQERAPPLARHNDNNPRPQNRFAKDDSRNRPRMDSLKNFSKQLTLAPSQHQQTHQHQPHQHHQHQQHPHNQHHQQQHQHQQHPHNQHQPQPHQQHQQSQSHQQHQQQQHQPHQPQQPSPQQQSATSVMQATMPDLTTSTPRTVNASTTVAPSTQASASTTTMGPATPVTVATPSTTAALATPPGDTSTNLELRDTSSNLSTSSSSSKDPSELARNSKLNPNAKEFVYKPRSPAVAQNQVGGLSHAPTSGSNMIDPATYMPFHMAPTTNIYATYMPSSVAQHFAPPQFAPPQFAPQQFAPQQFAPQQFAPQHFVPQHFVQQQMSPRYIRGNFQGYLPYTN